MNYLWEAMLYACENETDKNNIIFSPATTINPYMEVSFNDINSSSFENIVEVNSYYRFGEIFQFLLDGGMDNLPELRDTLFDILIHFLGEIDVKQGLSKKEYYGLFLKEESNKGVYGKERRNIIERFPYKQRRIVTESMVRLYILGASIELLRSVLKKLFSDSIVYLDIVDRKTLLIYIGKKETKELNTQVQFILDLFIPIDYIVKLFWEKHFGIIDVNATMIIEDIMIY